MSHSGLEVFNRNVQLGHEWVNDLDAMLGWDDRHRSYRMLRVMLQTLRECLPVSTAAGFAAQLPMILRGLFYEHWQPDAERHRYDLDRFLAALQAEFRLDPLESAADDASVVFEFLSRKVSDGEMAKMLHELPAPIRALR